MKTISKSLVILVICLLFGALGFAYYHNKSGSSIPSSENTTPATSTEASGAVIHHVALTANGASPIDLLIRVGEYVQFDSKDGKVHDIASGAGDGDGEHHDHTAAGLESGDFKADEGYRVQFIKIGSYYFHDHLNPMTTISIAVYQPEATSTQK